MKQTEVTSKNSRILNYFIELWVSIRQIGKSAWSLACSGWKLIVGAWLLVLVAALILKPYETNLLQAIRGEQVPWIYWVAKKISFWGDYHTGTLILSVTLCLAGFIGRRRPWRNTAIACLIAASAAGIFADFFRFGLGRARPNAGVEDGFYGLSWSSKFHGFPSGHTTTAFATMTPIAVSYPPLAIPCLAVAASVGWSRMYLNYHRPTDVLVGAGVGIAFGWTVGLVGRRRWAENADS